MLFDVDGCLVDIRKSYNTAIKRSVNFILKTFNLGRKLLVNHTRTNLVTNKVILRFRQTGGFNNDIDTSYAICLAELAKPHQRVIDARNFLYQVASNSNEDGIASVEKYLATLTSAAVIRELKNRLGYPGPPGKSILATIFDELFYGPNLFKKLHNLDPKYYWGKPLIENDRLVITKSTVKDLVRRFGGNLAVVSGRSRLAAEFSLRPIFGALGPNYSVFLEDEPREYAKPDPYAIIRAMESMDARTALYAGDAYEDLIMVRRAEKQKDFKIAFCGIYGCSSRPLETKAHLMKNGADFVIQDINELPNMLNNISLKR
jgi:phosphoglycolate phosphatase-like HAD superfamily hydrolase